jgi:hypothetical protein
MPVVAAVPLGGLATELGTNNDQLLALEARRQGAVLDATNAFTTFTGGSYQAWPGWPSVTIVVPDAIGVFLFGGIQFSTPSSAPNVALAIDGVLSELFNVSITSFSPQGLSVNAWSGPLSFGSHNFQVWAGSGLSATSPSQYLAVVPIQ